MDRAVKSTTDPVDFFPLNLSDGAMQNLSSSEFLLCEWLEPQMELQRSKI